MEEVDVQSTTMIGSSISTSTFTSITSYVGTVYPMFTLTASNSTIKYYSDGMPMVSQIVGWRIFMVVLGLAGGVFLVV